jgi:hypothetical protein
MCVIMQRLKELSKCKSTLANHTSLLSARTVEIEQLRDEKEALLSEISSRIAHNPHVELDRDDKDSLIPHMHNQELELVN